MNTAHQITFRALLFSAVLLAVSCSGGGGGNSNPTTPTPQNPVVAITSFTASLSQTASENQYSVHISARETAGQSPATLGALEFTLADANGATARATPDSVWSSTRLGPGTTVAARDMMLTGSREAQPVFTRLTARVVYTNDAQVSSSVTETIDIQQPQGPPPQTTFTIAGVVSEEPGGKAIVGASVGVVDGLNAARSATTDGNGYYSIPGLRAGSFTLRATKSGYETTDRGLTLSADTPVDLRMRTSAPAPVPPTPAPPTPPTPTPPPPPGDSMTCTGSTPATAPCGKPTARCNDGTYSCSQNRSGTCSSHDGVSCWICPGNLCQAVAPTFY